MDWYISRNGGKEGPFSSAQVRTLAESDSLLPTDLIWHQGMESWKPANQIQGLLTPPPLDVLRESGLQIGAGLGSPTAANGSSRPFAPAPIILASSREEPDVLSFPLASTWPRGFARIFDIWWESLLVGALVGWVLASYSSAYLNWINQPGSSMAFPIAILPFALLLDAVVFRLAGNTPGKAMMGIRVASVTGRQLEFEEYLRRNFSMWLRGLGLGIPIVNLFALWWQERRLRGGQQTTYDEAIGSNVWAKPIGMGRKLGFGCCFLCLCAFMIGLTAVDKDVERRNALAQAEQRKATAQRAQDNKAIDGNGNPVIVDGKPVNWADFTPIEEKGRPMPQTPAIDFTYDPNWKPTDDKGRPMPQTTQAIPDQRPYVPKLPAPAVVPDAIPGQTTQGAQSGAGQRYTLDGLIQERARRALAGDLSGAHALQGTIQAMQAREGRR